MNFDLATLLNKTKPYAYLLWHLALRQLNLVPWLFKALGLEILHAFDIVKTDQYEEKRWVFVKKLDYDKPRVNKFLSNLKLNKVVLLNPQDSTLADFGPEELFQKIVRKQGFAVFTTYEQAELAKHYATTSKNNLVSPQIARILNKKKNRVAAGTGAATTTNTSIYFKNKLYTSYNRFRIVDWLVWLRNMILLGFSALFASGLVLLISGKTYNFDMITDILLNKRLLFMNTFPIFVLMVLAYALFNSLQWSIIVGGAPFLIIAFVNYFMLKYRSFPFKWADIFLSKEAGNMGTRYSYMPPAKYLAVALSLIVLAVILSWIFKTNHTSIVRTIVLLVASVGSFAFLNKQYYQNNTYYTSVAEITRGNKWNETNRYMTNGFVYSFIHSVSESKLVAPDGYTEAKAKAALAKYPSKNIPKSKKVNFITIQLEAYNDFSKFKGIDIDPSAYAGLKQIQAESLSGELTTEIFGGGTVDTERKVLTGYKTMMKLNQNTSSFVRYFNDQDYTSLKLHPGYGWFYNRQNTSKYLGFDSFLYKENYYTKNVSKDSVIKDSLVFDDLYKQFNKITGSGKTLFNQTVTYQNHGPYDTTFTGTPLVTWKDGYNKSDYAIINNYLTGIKETNEALVKLLAKLKTSKEPVVLSFWGDHNPWGGANNSTYKMLGINLDQGTDEGFKNFYDTPYVMWANDAAKKELATQFSGKGPNISPMYVLPTMLKYLGVKGSSYNQYLQNLQETVPVFGLGKDLYEGGLTATLPAAVQKQVKEFEYVEYYEQTKVVK